MWRGLGAVILTGSGLWMGLQAAGGLRRRAEALGSWAEALSLLEGELSFRLPDLPRLLEEVSCRSPQPAGETLDMLCRRLSRLGEESFEELWTTALTQGAGSLTAEDLEPLCRLGAVLGRCGWEEQRAAAERCRLALERAEARLREELDRKGRVYGVTGASLGALLTILLL